MALRALFRAATLESTWRATRFVADVLPFTAALRDVEGLPASACLAAAADLRRLVMVATFFFVTLLLSPEVAGGRVGCPGILRQRRHRHELVKAGGGGVVHTSTGRTRKRREGRGASEAAGLGPRAQACSRPTRGWVGNDACLLRRASGGSRSCSILARPTS